jgi:hypothetical protein
MFVHNGQLFQCGGTHCPSSVRRCSIDAKINSNNSAAFLLQSVYMSFRFIFGFFLKSCQNRNFSNFAFLKSTCFWIYIFSDQYFVGNRYFKTGFFHAHRTSFE